MIRWIPFLYNYKNLSLDKTIITLCIRTLKNIVSLQEQVEYKIPVSEAIEAAKITSFGMNDILLYQDSEGESHFKTFMKGLGVTLISAPIYSAMWWSFRSFLHYVPVLNFLLDFLEFRRFLFMLNWRHFVFRFL
jgi:putative flippase GtrA